MQRLVSNQGKTVVCIIHQPSPELLNAFHQLILVADGRIAYSGPPNEATSFFERFTYLHLYRLKWRTKRVLQHICEFFRISGGVG